MKRGLRATHELRELWEPKYIFVRLPNPCREHGELKKDLRANHNSGSSGSQTEFPDVDGTFVTYVNKDVLTKSTVSIGIQVLNLRSANVVLADGRVGDWMWGQGNDASMVVPGRYIQQISPFLHTCSFVRSYIASS